ncbi:hypothetical protein BB560_006541 [Smittium megazygosporum]|uniref:guanosine-diphosphatase n=1 Tax=Smittium megazygosporum TaxID=133381 RepID=A0A2T9Y4G6_9FUNG|nr:hypothetical protein BB560_006541 [Smittium megazygosporum]
MLDAGSTGSRIHVYKFNYCKSRPELEDEVFEQIKPGLSHFDSDAIGAARSLDYLMEIALLNVPPSLRTCTPVSVKATAGLRLLGEEKSTQILKEVRNRLVTKYPFPLAKEKDPVAVMEGRDEGVFAWITVNYLLGVLGNNGTKSAGTFDLGGGSAQIVFEPSFDSNGDTSSNHFLSESSASSSQVNDFKHKFSYNKIDYKLYQHSYLGYGLMSAREKMIKKIVEDHSESGKSEVSHPCFPPAFNKIVKSHKDESSIKVVGTKVNKSPLKSAPEVEVEGEGEGTTGSFEQCLSVAKSILKTSDTCHIKPCSFSGVYQPDFSETFETNPFYIFSYFYDRTDPFKLGSEFKLKDIRNLAQKVCSHDTTLFTSPEEIKELESEKHYCLDLAYMYGLLKYGINIDDNRALKTTRKINDAETGWCLGAALSLISEGGYCSA